MMSTGSRVRRAIRRAPLVLLVAATLLAGGSAAAAQRRTNAVADAQAEFQHRLQNYIKLRQELAGKLKPLSPTASAAEISARQETLAAALRDVRKDARPGDVIPAAAAVEIKRIIAADFSRRKPRTKRAVFDEVPANVQPMINKTLPDTAALATVPPLLLNELPRLPDNLQYRFVGNAVVLLDGDTRLIVDYITNVIPAH